MPLCMGWRCRENRRVRRSGQKETGWGAQSTQGWGRHGHVSQEARERSGRRGWQGVKRPLGGLWGALHVTAGVMQSLASPGSPQAVWKTGRRGLGTSSVRGPPSRDAPGRSGEVRQGRGGAVTGCTPEQVTAVGGRGSVPQGTFGRQQRACAQRCPTPRTESGGIDAPAPAGRRPGVASTLGHFSPALGAQSRLR